MLQSILDSGTSLGPFSRPTRENTIRKCITNPGNKYMKLLCQAASKMISKKVNKLKIFLNWHCFVVSFCMNRFVGFQKSYNFSGNMCQKSPEKVCKTEAKVSEHEGQMEPRLVITLDTKKRKKTIKSNAKTVADNNRRILVLIPTRDARAQFSGLAGEGFGERGD